MKFAFGSRLRGVARCVRALIEARKSSVTTPPTVVWAAPDAGDVDGLDCPNCGSSQPKPHVLSVDFTPPLRARQVWRVVGCRHCTCRFYERQDVADYADDEMLTRGRSALYLQQGAGLGQLIKPVAMLSFPAGARYLDIGCGFGFGLDFAVTAKAWRGQGIDPAQIAGLGRELLGLPIDQRLLGADEPALRGTCDVVMAAETIEHVPQPAAFLALIKDTLALGGVVVLTTPDGDALHPQTPPGQLVSLLSPELHLVLQSERSLRMLLANAGFGHIHIVRDGGALVAHASTRPLCFVSDPIAIRADYRSYLERRFADFGADSDLFWGFGGRAFLEAVNDGDIETARRLRQPLAKACLGRFGIDLDAPALPYETATCSLERMTDLMPLNAASIFFADAMRALAEGASRQSQENTFCIAAGAADRLRRAVGELAMEDALSEDIGWVSKAEALLCAASRKPAASESGNVAARLMALPPAPGHNSSRRDAVITAAFINLVNAGSYRDARKVLLGFPLLQASPSGVATQVQRDAVFCRAVVDLQPDGDASAAQSGFAWVRQQFDNLKNVSVTVQLPDLYWAALRGEVQAYEILGQHDKAAYLSRMLKAN